MIDTKLIAAHQWVVDETQKKPGWWAEQAIMATTALDLVRRVLTWSSGWDAVVLLLSLVMCAVMVHAARTPAFLKIFGDSRGIRGFMMGLVAYRIIMLFIDERTGIVILDTVSSTCLLSYYCFAACDEPKPPKRKEKLVPTLA